MAQGENMLTIQSFNVLEDDLDEELAFKYDELMNAEPEIFELVEKGDFDGLQKLLNQVGGY